ncbi:hypothetical protein MIND_00200400 [Mycena indigotica]|uniref:F-box domain-containing protein n=1 Tax=Mycena indigotica TaxID=2126181 RepID=A0A8H6T521_9AGAR|nr:uncharacterized protein MIND_00200400 [Mycena indigotica]KAF7311893.1 hypothetical protein MIND_00200400 [Mycena indigotica]
MLKPYLDHEMQESSSGISTLPTEILITILDDCPDIAPDGPDFQSANFLCYVRLSHVCQRWRDILLDRPQYWSHIVLSKPRWAEEMLVRSETAPLTVGLNFGAASESPETAAVRTLLFEQFHRVKEIHIKLGLYNDGPAPIFAHPAPMLERLHIRMEPNYIYGLREDSFSGEAPRLRHLSLHHCLLPKECRSLWRGLTSLELTGIAHEIYAPILELLVFLRDNTPHLRALLLNKILVPLEPESGYAPATIRNPIRLERLKELTLRPNNWSCTAFLRCVALPKMRQLVVEICPGDPDERGIWEALDRVGGADKICSLELRDSILPGEGNYGDDQIVFEIRLGRATDWEPETSTPEFRVTARFVPTTVDRRREHWREKLIIAMLSHRHSRSSEHTQLTTLIVACDDLDWPVTGLLLQQSICNMAFYRSPSMFLVALAAVSADSRPDLDKRPLLGLKRLAFVGIVLRTNQIQNAFFAWLSQRKLLGLPLEELHFDYCASENGAPCPPVEARPALTKLVQVGRSVILEYQCQ